jgi:hypothetical protein
MEEYSHPARQSSGIYAGNLTFHAVGSEDALARTSFPFAFCNTDKTHRNACAENAAMYAGSRFSETQGLSNPAGSIGEEDVPPLPTAPAPAATTAEAPVPLYKRRWFIIANIIMIPIGIALLFVLLFPVVSAIAQMVINRSVLNVQLAEINEPQNNT